MPLPERVIMDSSAFCALLSAADANHELAVQTYERLIDREQEVWTASYVLTEFLAFVHRELGFEPMRIFAESIHGILHIFWVESRAYEEAWTQMMELQSAGLSLVDWLTVIVGRRLGAYVFTFNKNFIEIGMPVLPR